ncbi:response regulator [Dictyobacter aurantiacus]|uniref:DNA-binding response regulator n=1 Tax=Dictyobacter aurantiacus TaxID=1936993 RepID=A0A401Z962_9CHLR|nr:DNA-binding response regulator [Dictyobacter aurantiacus]
MSEQEPITILLVDDHAIVRRGLRALFALQPDCQVVGEANSGEEAIRLAAKLVPDIILMDLVMPDFDGIEATKRAKEVSPRSQVIVLTSFHDDVHIFPALHAGALSYVLKDVDPDELVETVHRAVRGESILHPQVATRVLQELRQSRQPSTNPFAQLSEREQDVLRLIADGRSNAEIATRLVISEKTVKNHVSNILSKLHLLDRTQAAVFAWQQGFMRQEE